MEEFPLLIPGAAPATGQITVTAPYDEAPIAQVATGDAGHVEMAMSTAYTLFRDRHTWLSLAERIAVLQGALAHGGHHGFGGPEP